MKIFAVAPAGGSSSRFGSENKLLYKLNGKPILQYVIDSLIMSKISATVIVSGCYKHVIEGISENKRILFTHNSNWQKGMGSSISEGVKYLLKKFDTRNSAIILLNADMPYISAEIIDMIIDSHLENKKLITVPLFKGIYGHPVIFDSSYIDKLLLLKGEIGGKNILKENIDKINFINIDNEAIIKDIDYKNFS